MNSYVLWNSEVNTTFIWDFNHEMVNVKTSIKLLQEQEIILILYICHTAVGNAKILQKQKVNNLKTWKKKCIVFCGVSKFSTQID